MEVLSSWILLRPTDPARSRRFYRDILGLAVYREFGPSHDPGLVFFLGQGLLEISGRSDGRPGQTLALWLQVRDSRAEQERLLAAGPGGDHPGFGGPETLTLAELARQYQAGRGIRRRIVGLRLPGFALRAAGPQTCPDGRHGKTTWAEWLAQH